MMKQLPVLPTVKLAFREHRSKLAMSNNPPLVMLHGALGSKQNFNHAAKVLSKNRPVFTVDLRNHGQSPRAAPHTYTAMANDVLSLISWHEKLRGKVDILGFSMGAKVAALTALELQERVNKLVCVDMAPCKIDHLQEPFVDNCAKIVELQDSVAPENWKEMVRNEFEALPCNNGMQAAYFASGFGVVDKHLSYTVPLKLLPTLFEDLMDWPESDKQCLSKALFFKGELSDYINPSTERAISQYFPNSQVVEIKGAGHNLIFEKPAEFMSVLEKFLQE